MFVWYNWTSTFLQVSEKTEISKASNRKVRNVISYSEEFLEDNKYDSSDTVNIIRS